MNLNKKKGAELLIEDTVFIILNIVFISLLIVFVFSKTGSGANLEEIYSKKIALMIDAAEPGMQIYLNMEDAIKIAEKEKVDLNEGVVTIKDNIVTVKLREKGGYSYSFFNDVSVRRISPPPESENLNKGYIFLIDKKNDV
ncbi:hypothetical protein K0A97_02440 [Patescibacteria group bacterium]|nr:hypothetical protein [Patescibacteria group bacterium]